MRAPASLNVLRINTKVFLRQSLTKLLERWLISSAPLPHFNVVRRKGKTRPTFEQTFAATILNVKSTLNGGKGGCWIFFLNLNVKQGVVRCAFQLLLSLIVYYANIVWANNYHSRVDKLSKLQKNLIRIMTFSKYNAPSLPLFHKLKLLNIHQINGFLTACFTFKLCSILL